MNAASEKVQQHVGAKYTSHDALNCPIDTVQISSESETVNAISELTFAETTDTCRIERVDAIGGYKDYTFYLHVSTAGGPQAATLVVGPLELKSPCKNPSLSFTIASDFIEGPIVDEGTYTIVQFENIHGCIPESYAIQVGGTGGYQTSYSDSMITYPAPSCGTT
jgi:hypothetical protein